MNLHHDRRLLNVNILPIKAKGNNASLMNYGDEFSSEKEYYRLCNKGVSNQLTYLPFNLGKNLFL